MNCRGVRRPWRSFDRIARAYRWLEYATFGRALKRTRELYLGELESARHALVLGDGDGRFLASLLARNQQLRAVAIDESERMLGLLATRCRAAGDRLVTRRGDLGADASRLVATEQAVKFDLVVTHYFFDCLSATNLEHLVRSVLPVLSPGARWVVSEFRLPRRGLARAIGYVLIRSLYFAFRLLTGLRVQHLPDYSAALTRAGFQLRRRELRLRGLLVGDLWQLSAVTTSKEASVLTVTVGDAVP